MDSENMATTLHNMNKCRSRHTSLQDLSAISRTTQDDEISQDHFSLSSTIPHSQDMDQWTLSTSDSMESSPIGTQPETPEVAMLSYSFSQQLIPGATGINDSAAMFHSLSDIQAAGGLGENTEMDYSHPHHFAQAFASSLFEYNYENDEAAQRCMHDDSASLGHNSPHEDGQLFSTQDTWNLTMDTTNLVGAQYDQIPHVYSPPVSPPLTETSQVSVNSACSQPAYYQINEEKINIQDSFHPLSPPLNEQDPNRFVHSISWFDGRVLTNHRTIRPTKQSQRPLLSASTSRLGRKSDPEAYPLPVGETVRGANDKAEIRTPRDHPYYSLSTQSDGKYYCPFATGENPCNHTPTTQKCAYQ